MLYNIIMTNQHTPPTTPNFCDYLLIPFALICMTYCCVDVFTKEIIIPHYKKFLSRVQEQLIVAAPDIDTQIAPTCVITQSKYAGIPIVRRIKVKATQGVFGHNKRCILKFRFIYPKQTLLKRVKISTQRLK